MTGEIEIAVIGEINGRCLIGPGGVFDLQGVVAGEDVIDRELERAGVVFFAVGAGVAEADAGARISFQGLSLPVDSAEGSVSAAVEVVRGMVDGELDYFFVVVVAKPQAAVGDAVCVASGDATEVLVGVGCVVLLVVETEDNVGGDPVRIGDVKFGERSPAAEPLGAESVTVVGEKVHGELAA